MKREAESTTTTDSEPGLGVVRAGGEYRLVAIRPFVAGERLFRMEGEPSPHATRYTVQIDDGLHLEMPSGTTVEQALDRYFWRFMNHSCEPNSFIEGRDVFALGEIGLGEAVTFNYNTTEYDMAEPFECRCGSEHCLGPIRGFKHLPESERQRLGPFLARYLRPRLRVSEPGGKARGGDDRASSRARGPAPVRRIGGGIQQGHARAAGEE